MFLAWNIFVYFLAMVGAIALIAAIREWWQDQQIDYEWLDKHGYRHSDGEFRRSHTGEFLRPIAKLTFPKGKE